MKRHIRIETLLGLGAILALGGVAQAQGAAPGGPGTVIDQTVVEQTTTESGGADAPSNLGQTGGEPLLMVIGGLALAGGAFALRRKLA